MKKDEATYLELMARYFKGELSDTEKQDLFHWVRRSRENQAIYDQMQQIWTFSNQLDQDYEPEVEKGWQGFNQKLAAGRENNSNNRLEIRPASFSSRFYYRAAAVILIFLTAGLILLRQWNQPDQQMIITAVGETKEIVLPDSSKVWLNQQSSLAYEEDFDQIRQVHLTGEAFFQVEKTQGKRFTVYTPDGKVEVLGTSFNVNTRKNDSLMIHVITGRVAVSPLETENYTYLSPGQLGVVNTAQSTAVESFEDQNFQAWRTGNLSFTSSSLKKVINHLESYFDVKIEIRNKNLLNCKFTGQFQDPELSEVIQVLQTSMDLSVQQNDKLIILSGQGCN